MYEVDSASHVDWRAINQPSKLFDHYRYAVLYIHFDFFALLTNITEKQQEMESHCLLRFAGTPDISRDFVCRSVGAKHDPNCSR